MAERLFCKQGVTGSNPVVGSTYPRERDIRAFSLCNPTMEDSMDRDRNAGEELFRRAAMEYAVEERGRDRPRPQAVPVNVYETDDDLVVVAPMPGVEADNIDIEIHGMTLTLRATLRGQGQQDRRYLVHEWTYGPYARSIDLPHEVDASRANASHGNGVLVLTLPKAAHMRAVRVPLRHVGSSQDRHEGHSGHSGDGDTA
jgi:HSP20 family protein